MEKPWQFKKGENGVPWTNADNDGTISVSLIRQRYREAGLFHWTTQRVLRICAQIRCTPDQLCSAAGYFRPPETARKLITGVWPPWLAIHFEKIEHQIHRMKFKCEPNPGPSMSDIVQAKLIAGMLEPPQEK